MASEVDVCNYALMRIGNSQTIANIGEGSAQSIACTLLLPLVREVVLRDFPWPFATKREALALLNETPPQNWAYAYAMPSDCLKVRAIEIPGLRVSRHDQKIPYEVAGRKIYTDEPEATLLYTYKVDDLSLWDPMAISALAWALAVELALGVAGKVDFSNAAKQAYRLAIGEAWASALSEGHDIEPTSEFLSWRGYGDSSAFERLV